MSMQEHLIKQHSFTLKYSTKSLHVILQPLISFMIRFSFASSCGTSTFNWDL